MRIAMTDLFTTTLLVCGPSPEDEAGAAMTRYQLQLVQFWHTQLPPERLAGYERRELLTQFFIWEQQERVLASIDRIHEELSR